MAGLRDLITGTCCAWALPVDPSCAKAARQLYQDAASEVGITADLIYDGITMASELAANTLHAYESYGSRGGLRPPIAALPELWVYLRGSGPRRELVCKIFDAYPGWKTGTAPGRSPDRASAQAVSGRGLQVVHELSQGRWGHHLTRARLSVRRVRGKAVWFALPIPPAAGRVPGQNDTAEGAPPETSAIDRCRQLSAGQAMRELEAMLAARGLGGRLVRADKPAGDVSVLWVSRGLTVWCREGAISMQTPAGESHYWTYEDLVDVTERAVCMHEEIEQAAGPAVARA
ncbi:MAG TPA: hypothetical protein VGN41_24105 [Streptosporangiaceae bacterium]